MQRVHSTLSAVGLFVSSAVLFPPVLSLPPFWLREVGAGDALVVTLIGLTLMAGAILACARRRLDGAALTTVTLS